MKILNKLSLALNLILLVLVGFLVLKNDGKTETKKQPEKKPAVKTAANDFGPYYNQKKSLFEVLPNTPHEIIFLGNSITDYCEWAELFQNPAMKNRGIGGDVTRGVLARLKEVTESKPDKIFIMIGINDLCRGIPSDTVLLNYRKILDQIAADSPDTRVFVESVLPMAPPHSIKENDTVVVFNEKLKKLTIEKSLPFINLHDRFTDSKGLLKQDFTIDGIHLTGKGYLQWKQMIEDYVNKP